MDSEQFTGKAKEELGVTAKHREVLQAEDRFALREPLPAYTTDFDS